MTNTPPTIAVVGPCASGKSTLIEKLKKRGYTAKHIAQEHSFVPDLWRKRAEPDVLIYLDVSFEESKQRQNISESPKSLYKNQIERLRHAREHADLFLNTTNLTPGEVFQQVQEYINQLKL
ncbi:MAG: hypothetical protein B6I38_11635 [Anaerolineaceae bacterium 4572_5.1]|nr:MAG: hypothetical protein B6I38_11635 [Anaerolineaceae bacterium 4572_5.1]